MNLKLLYFAKKIDLVSHPAYDKEIESIHRFIYLFNSWRYIDTCFLFIKYTATNLWLISVGFLPLDAKCLIVPCISTFDNCFVVEVTFIVMSPTKHSILRLFWLRSIVYPLFVFTAFAMSYFKLIYAFLYPNFCCFYIFNLSNCVFWWSVGVAS